MIPSIITNRKNLSRVGFFLFLLFPFWVEAAQPLDLIINEIAWMGREKAWYEEWIELYNNTQREIDLSHWKIENGGTNNKSLEILKGKIPAKGFFLICKKGMENCDFQNWNLSLNDNYQRNGALILRDPQGKIIDQTPLANSQNWPAGNKETKKTMERKEKMKTGSDPENWQTSQDPGGTPKRENIFLSKIGEKKDQLKINYPSGIIINEIFPSSQGSDQTEEWIEIFNQNDFEVDLDGWQITDLQGKTKIYTFSKTKIPPQGFLVLTRQITKIVLNNNGDGLILFQPDGKISDSVSYEKAFRGKSYARINSQWIWSSYPTPGFPNQLALTSQETKKGGNLENEKNREILEEEKFNQNPSFLPFFLGLSFSLFSGIMILILKKKLKIVYN